MVTAYLVFLLLLACERLFELRLSRRNAARLLARGGVESGAGHFRPMQGLHAAFFVACALEVIVLERPFRLGLAVPMAALIVAAQGLRWWAVATLGERWNVRVIALPGAPAVTDGPYRFLRHPNYLAVAFEGIAVPLLHSAWWTALGFTLANTALLAVRIQTEERALGEHCDYAARLGDRARFWPRRARGAGS
jgi:methyltransferase